MNVFKEASDGAVLFGPELCRPDLIDEESIALLGGDAARRGVGLHEIALAFEHGHLTANRRR